MTPIIKKDDLLDKSIYRPVNILPFLSKLYERIIYNPLLHLSKQFLNSILCGFCKTHSTQHGIFKLLQSWQEESDKRNLVGTILVYSHMNYYLLNENAMVYLKSV